LILPTCQTPSTPNTLVTSGIKQPHFSIVADGHEKEKLWQPFL
jgi:hypothetical protein